MQKLWFIILTSFLAGCASKMSPGDVGHYSETLENNPDTQRKAYEIMRVINLKKD